MTEIIAIFISCLALIISAITAWLTLLQKGTVRMTQPTVIYFGPDGSIGAPSKIFLRTLLYCTAKRGRIIENMYVKIKRGESVQNFNIWVYGDNLLARGSGLFVGENGITCNHHFLLPKDGTQFEFFSGEYTVEVYATLVGQRKSLLMSKIELFLNEIHSLSMGKKKIGVYFDWGPDSGKYYSHVDERDEFPPSIQDL